jgi:hypothetical protein
MEFESYLANMPPLHSWDQGKTWNSGGFDADHLRRLGNFLASKLSPGPAILETGAGNSTISFSFLQPSRQVAICPDEALFGRIREYCAEHGISTAHMDLRIGCSEWILPEMAAAMRQESTYQDAQPFQFALIDGKHNWPTTFVDFFYINFMLRAGSYLMIDDIHLYSVKEMARFLNEEPGFEIALDLGKALVFQKKTDDAEIAEWNESPYILRRTKDHRYRRNLFALKRENRYVLRKNPYAL